MQRIHILSAHEAQKIAAGEVVESPAHVVKELIENALDAQATTIAIAVEDAGKQSIIITDNGCGMCKEDANLSIMAHATSKINSVNDLVTIATFGFRGEALASIAAVSKLTLTTKEEAATQGIKLEIDAGHIINETACSCPTGTQLVINDLLYNVPARKKFLKSSETEWRAILHVVHAFCMTHLTVHVRLAHDGKELLNCAPVNTAQERVAQLRDFHYVKHILSVPETTEGGMSVHGIITNHQFARFDRSQFFFFINRRLVKNPALSKAVLKGYANVLPPGRFPAVYIFLTIDSESVDVNVHPRKEEVQFLHPRKVEVLIEKAIKATLDKHLSTTILGSQRVETAPALTAAHMPQTHHIPTQSAYRPFVLQQPLSYIPEKSSPSTTLINQGAIAEEPGIIQNKLPIKPPLAEQQVSFVEQPAFTPQAHKQYAIVGNYNNTYIILSTSDGMLLIDQHAAHERILYELFSKRFEDIASVPLLFPQLIQLSRDDVKTIEPHLSIFANLGIKLEVFAEDRLSIHALPVHLKNQAIDDIVRSMISVVLDNGSIEKDALAKLMHEKLRAQMACKAAVKAGDQLTQEHMQQLVRDLYETPNHLTCPHGRPTCWLIGLHEIERKFKRISG